MKKLFRKEGNGLSIDLVKNKETGEAAIAVSVGNKHCIIEHYGDVLDVAMALAHGSVSLKVLNEPEDAEAFLGTIKTLVNDFDKYKINEGDNPLGTLHTNN